MPHGGTATDPLANRTVHKLNVEVTYCPSFKLLRGQEGGKRQRWVRAPAKTTCLAKDGFDAPTPRMDPIANDIVRKLDIGSTYGPNLKSLRGREGG